MNAMDKAGGILGAKKKRELVDAGLVVVHKTRLDTLELIAMYAKDYRKEMMKRPMNETSGEYLMRRNLDNFLDALSTMSDE